MHRKQDMYASAEHLYHWQEGSQNKSITVGDLAIYGEKVEAKNIAKMQM